MSAYYSLQVSGAKDVVWESRFGPLGSKAPSLYVEVELANAIQKSNTIRDDISPAWDEAFPLVCPPTSMSISVKLKHRSRVKGGDKTVGYVEVELIDLLNRCKDGETGLRLFRNSEPTATITVQLAVSDSKAVAELALQNLIRDMPPIRSGDILGKAASLASEGKDAIKSDLAQELKAAVPAIDNFVTVMDTIADAHPYMKVAWFVISAVYKIVSAQIKADERFRNLTKAMANMFRSLKEVDHLHDVLQSVEDTISEILGVITECCLLLRNHVRHSFVGRSLGTSDKAKIDGLTTSLNDLGKALNDGFVRQAVVVAERIEKLAEETVKITEKTAETTEGTARQVDVLRLFQSLDLSPKEESNAFDRPRCLPDTRTAIRQQIIEWASSETAPNIFWLNGEAGSGKSTIATSIADHFRNESKLGAYLFFTRDKSRPSSVISDLAYKLASAYPPLASHLSSVFGQPKDLSSASANSQFEELLQKPLSSCESDIHGPIVIILDALDECGTASSRSSLIQLLQNELAKLPSKFRFLITSRPEDDIWRAFSSRQDVRTYELSSNSTDSQDDVRTYLIHELPRMITELPEGWTWDKIVKVLSDAAGGLFIWASTLVKLVKGKTFPSKYLINLVSNTKSLSLQALYGVVLKDAFQWDDETKSTFLMVIALVLFGNTQLSDKTIDGILGLSPQEGSANILSKLRSVIAYESGKPIRLHHASFYDYLTSTSSSREPWHIEIVGQKHMIAERCFDVMASSLRFNICDFETSFVRNDDVVDLADRIERSIPPHLDYVCCFWSQHLRDVSFSGDLLKLLMTFAHEHLLYWLEVLSLTKNVYRLAVQALRDAIEWIGDKEPELSSFFGQAVKLASTFAVPISESTPHIYVSMLPLAEQDSIISCHYAKLASSLVTVDRRGAKYKTSLLKIIEGHPGLVSSVEFSPDGKRVVSGSFDETIRVWEVESGKLVAAPFEGHSDWVTSVGFSPDGKRVVSGSHDKTVRVWEVESGKLVAAPFEGHSDPVSSVGFSPDGKRVVSGSFDKTVRVWEVESGKLVGAPFEGHSYGVTSVGFSSDGTRVVSGSRDRTVRVWEVESGKLVAAPFEGHSDWVTSVGFSPDGRRVVSGSSDKTVRVWEVESGKLVAAPFEGHSGSVTSVGFSPDGTRVVSGSDDNTVRVWEVESGKLVAAPFEGHSGTVNSVGLSRDGTRVVSGSYDETVRVWEVESGKLVAAPFEGHSLSVTSVGFSPDGKRVVSGSSDKTVRVWEVESGKLAAAPFEEHTNWVTSVEFSPDGTRVVSGSWDKTVRVWEVESGKLIAAPFEGHSYGVTSVGFSPDGKHVVSGSEDKTVRVWEVESGKLVAAPFEGHSDSVTSVGFSPDGKRVVSGSWDKTVRVWEVESGKPVAAPFEGHSGSVASVGFSPDGKHVVSGSYDKTVRVWVVESGKLAAAPFEGHFNWVTYVGFSPDGMRVVSGSRDKTIRVWEVDSGQQLSSTSDIPSISTLSRNGKRVVSVDSGETIRVSDVVAADDLASLPGEFFDWVMEVDYWIRSKEGKLLLWIPPDIRPTLWRANNVAVLNCRFSTRPDFTNCALGRKWYDTKT